MKVLFVQAYRERAGVEYLSAYLKKHGHDVELFFDPMIFNNTSFQIDRLSRVFDFEPFLRQRIKVSRPDIVAFSVLTLEYQWALKRAETIKRVDPTIPVVFGGIHPTLCPEVVIQNPFVDAVCVGEGELPLLKFVESHAKGERDPRIPNFWIKTDNGIVKNAVEFINESLDQLPFPDKQLFYDANPLFKRNYSIALGRGCVFNCSYCCHNVLRKIYCKSKYFRKRGIENSIAELVQAKRHYHPKRVEFMDDTFLCGDRNYAKDFLREYKKEVDLPYTCNSHCNFLDDEICQLLKESQCVMLEMGIQSCDEQYRKKYLFRNETNEDYRRVAAILHRHKIPFALDHIFNLPSEKEESYKNAALFYNELRPSYMSTFWLQYFPGADILDIAVREKIIDEKGRACINNGLANGRFSLSVGGTDYFNVERQYFNYQFWFTLIPLVPRKIFQKLFLRFYRHPKKCANTSILFFHFLAKIKVGFGFWMAEDIEFHIVSIWRYYKRKFFISKAR